MDSDSIICTIVDMRKCFIRYPTVIIFWAKHFASYICPCLSKYVPTYLHNVCKRKFFDFSGTIPIPLVKTVDIFFDTMDPFLGLTAAMSVGAGFLTYYIIPRFRDVFIKANLYGIDLNKATGDKVPEATGVITGELGAVGRVADPVHFRPDPDPDQDPANQNFKIGSRILLALKESIQTSNIFLLIFE